MHSEKTSPNEKMEYRRIIYEILSHLRSALLWMQSVRMWTVGQMAETGRKCLLDIHGKEACQQQLKPIPLRLYLIFTFISTSLQYIVIAFIMGSWYMYGVHVFLFISPSLSLPPSFGFLHTSKRSVSLGRSISNQNRLSFPEKSYLLTLTLRTSA